MTSLKLVAFSALATVLGFDRTVSFKGNTLKIHNLSSPEAHRILALLNPDLSTTHETKIDGEKLAEQIAQSAGPKATPSATPPVEASAEVKPPKPPKVRKSPEPAETKSVPLLEATLEPPPPAGLSETPSTTVPVDADGNPDPWGLNTKAPPAEAPAAVGDIDVSRFDAKRLGDMGKLRDILPYLREEMGVMGYKAMLKTCTALKTANLSPILSRIENLEERLTRGFETLGWSTED